MPHVAIIKYDRPLVRRALNCYFVRRLGRPVIVLFGLLCAYLAYNWFSGSWGRTSTYIAIPIVVIVSVLGLSYFARLRTSEGFFGKTKDPTVSITFSESGVKTESDLGSSEIKWAAFDEILKFVDVWLLVYAKSGYITLPVDQLSPECQKFIDERMTAKAL